MPQRANQDHPAQPARSFFALFGLLLCVFLPVLPASAERLPVKTYTTADGLPRDTVSRIRLDSRGFLWFCTGEGLSRFDGTKMTNFTTSDGLPSGETNDFLETKSGKIYIATGKGLARLNPKGTHGSVENPLFTAFSPDDPRSEKILTLYEDKNNQIWVGTSDGLYKLIEKGEHLAFQRISLGTALTGTGGAIFEPGPNTIYVDEILEDRHGSLWVGTFGSGLFRLSTDGTVRRFRAPDDFTDNKITALFEDRDGRLWMGMRSDEEGGVCLLDPTAAEKPVRKCYTVKDGLGSNRIRDIFQTSDNQMWLGTVPGLCRWQGDGGTTVCKTYTEKNDLCSEIHALAEDPDGNLWTGSTCGAKKIARYGFTTYDESDGLDENQVNAAFENSAGEFFVTNFPKNGRIVSRFDGEKFTSVKLNLPEYVNYHGWGWQQTVWQDSAGAWWIPTGYGLFRSPEKTSFENLANVSFVKPVYGAEGVEPFRVFEDSRGDVWASMTGYVNKLLRWERAGNVWHDHTAQAGIGEYRIGTAFSEDRAGNVWIGASSDHKDGALIRVRPGGEFQIFTGKDGAPTGWTTDLFLDSRGRLWIATSENGLLRLDDPNSERPEFTGYTPAEGLTSLTTTSVTEDEFGRIYVGTWRGIDRLTPETGQFENFSTADGLPGGYIESSYRDRKNNLWFLTDKGLARFSPEPVRVRKPPNILITGLRVEGEPQSISILGETEIPPLDLRSDQRQLTIEFLGLGTSLGEKLKYEYRFGDADWTPTGERTLNFANLAPGDYRFEVRAQTIDRIYSQTAARLSVRIAAPLWQRWWFLTLTALAFAGVIYLIYQNRLRRLLELEKMRTRIATDLHDDIGSNLTKITIMSEVARRINGEKQGEILNSIADISRSSVSSMSDIVWAINPAKDSLLELTRRMRTLAEDILGQDDVRVDFKAPEMFGEIKLDADVRRNVFLIFKESLNNIVRHARASTVRIELEVVRSHLRMTIADDGTGFDAAQNYDGNGLLNIRRRAADLKGSLEIDSKPGSGTRILLEVPLKF